MEAGFSEAFSDGVLILQKGYIDEPAAVEYGLSKEARVAAWPVQFFQPPRCNMQTIPAVLSPEEPTDRLDIICGVAGDGGATE